MRCVKWVWWGCFGSQRNRVRFAKDGRTPLIQASMKGHIEVVGVLVEHGADLNAADRVRIFVLFLGSGLVNVR